MGLNISQTMNNSQFENRESLRRTAKNILLKQNASNENAQKIIDQLIFLPNARKINTQADILNISSQIAIQNSMKETIKSLKDNFAKKNVKKAQLGELFELLDLDTGSYAGELVDYEINYNNNIFIAA